eukprot:2057896-Heterocapsa_arctica.AAC.1
MYNEFDEQITDTRVTDMFNIYTHICMKEYKLYTYECMHAYDWMKDLNDLFNDMLEAKTIEFQKEKDEICGDTNMFVQEIRGENLNKKTK